MGSGAGPEPPTLAARYSRRRALHAALSAATRTRFNHAVIELRLQDGHGIALIERLRALHPPMRMVVITGFDSFASVIVALRRHERLSAQADR
jgi:ActR/RegA family two-component response regulator